MDFHPLAEIFPLMDGAEFDGLVDDIKRHGLREPIILFEDKILDGRNRYRACEAANVEPIYQEWMPEGSAQAFVISKNLHRRHLSESQRSLIAAKIATAPRGGDRKSDQTANPQFDPPTTAEAAKMLNVGERTVYEAKTVLRHGTPEEIEAVESGKAAVVTIGKQIRSGMAPRTREKKRAETLSQSGKNPERIQRQQINAEIWGRIRDALTHLTSLPLPGEAAVIARANDKTGLVDARLPKATQWLKDFSDAWNEPKAAANRDADAGAGDRAA